MMTDLRETIFEDRLGALHLTRIGRAARRIRDDLIETFKILMGHADVDYSRLFSLSGGVLRGHSMKLFKPRCRTNLRKSILSDRMVDVRNDLDQDVIDSNNVDNFNKKGLR